MLTDPRALALFKVLIMVTSTAGWVDQLSLNYVLTIVFYSESKQKKLRTSSDSRMPCPFPGLLLPQITLQILKSSFWKLTYNTMLYLSSYVIF